MITLAQIKDFVRSISEIKIVEKDFSVNVTSYHLAGIYKQNGETKILLLAYNETICEIREEIEALRFEFANQADIPTFREEERLSIKFEKDFAGIKSVSCGENCCFICSSQTSQLSNNEAEHAILLSEFIKSGWNCPCFADLNPDNIYIISCVLSDCEKTDFSQKTVIAFRPDNKRYLAEIPLLLNPGESNKEIKLSDGKIIYIRKISPFDLHKHTEEIFSHEKIINSFSPKELEEKKKEIDESNEKLCPKGQCFITVEYEAPENISIDIKTVKTLDSRISHSGGAFGIIASSSLTPTHKGYSVKVAAINEPFTPDFKSVEAEIFSYSEKIQIEEIEI